MNLIRRIRGAIGTGLTWAAIWAVAGVLIGAASNVVPMVPWNSFFEIFDAPLPTLAIPGFVGGALFSIVLTLAGRGREFDDLSVPKFAAWGALGGLLLSLVPAAFFGSGFGTATNAHSLFQVTTVIAGPFIVLSSISAVISLMLARRARVTTSKDAQGLTDSGRTQLETERSVNVRSTDAVREASNESLRS